MIKRELTHTETALFFFLLHRLEENEQVAVSVRELQSALKIKSRKSLEKSLKTLDYFFLRTKEKTKKTLFSFNQKGGQFSIKKGDSCKMNENNKLDNDLDHKNGEKGDSFQSKRGTVANETKILDFEPVFTKKGDSCKMNENNNLNNDLAPKNGEKGDSFNRESHATIKKTMGYENEIDVFFDSNFLKRKVTKEKDTDVLISKEKYKKENSQKTFVAPTLEEVKIYALSIQEAQKLTVEDCELYSLQFWNWYDSVNWFVGKKKMIRWHSAFVGWTLRNQNFRAKPPRGQKTVNQQPVTNEKKLAKENEDYFKKH